jgi:hypothetical protein
MGSDWVEEIPDRSWINKEKQRERKIKDFLKLVQQGERTEFLVQDKEMNEDIKPCFYLNSILDQNFTNFRELPNTRYKPSETVEGHGFEKERFEEVEITELEHFSQSSLNRFAKSPRLYFIEKLMDSETDVNMRKGSLFHDYAEFYANNPEKASEIELEEIVDHMMDELTRFVDGSELDSLRTKCRIGIKNIRKFFDRKSVEPHNISSYSLSGKSEKNYFCDVYDEEIESDFTEVQFERDDLGVRGKIDLILDDSEIADFKSGKQYSRQKTVKRSKIDLFEDQDRPNFQPLMYLAQHAERIEEDQVLEFTLYNFLSDIGGEVSGKTDFTGCLTTMRYYPQRFDEKVGSMQVFEHLIKDVAKSNDRRKTLENLGYTRYESFFEDNEMPETYSKKEILETEFADEFESYVKGVVGDYKYVEKGCASALKKLVAFRTENYFVEDVEKFKEFVQQKIEEMNECRENGFPVDANPDDLRHRDMIAK